MTKGLPSLEKFVYLAACVLSLGGAWVAKIIFKAALLEAQESQRS